MNLTGNTILLTGGATGIGFELAKQLLQRGNKVIITGRSQAKLDAAKAKLPELVAIQSDVSQPAAIDALYATVTKDFPALNVLINNAGIMRSLNLHKEDDSLDAITQEIDTNLAGPVRMVRRFLTHLKSKPAAAIVNVSSGLAFVPLPTAPVYCAAKAALPASTLSLRVQLKNTPVKVFEIAPPATQTELLADWNAEDMKGIPIMKVEDMVTACMRGMEDDRFEIRPGQSNQLRFMNRVAPDFILAQLSKPVDRMLATK